MKPLGYLHDYYTRVRPHPRVLELCGAVDPDAPYTSERDSDLTVIVNAYARAEFLPLIWEAVQYQSRRPRYTWIVQNAPEDGSRPPYEFFEAARTDPGTRVITSDINHGCWFRFLLAAFSCRTRYVAIYDDDTLSGRLALETALDCLAATPGLYGGRGITFKYEPGGPGFWNHEVSGWPTGTELATQVDFAGHLWVMETGWLRELFKYLPERIFTEAHPAHECGEDMYLSFVAQKAGIPTFTFPHGPVCNARWSSIQAYEMGMHPNAMNVRGNLGHGDFYLRQFVGAGWKLLRYRQ